MIMVHRLKGEPMLLNADLITTIETNPDTVITLADGRRLVVSDLAEDIVDRVRLFRASVLAAAGEIRETSAPSLVTLRPVPDPRDETA